ncbi:MAG: plasmid mobilization protein [Haloechinothrix sp.]
MSKRLQVILRDEEFERLREVAREQGLTVSEWVRQVLRRARTEGPAIDRARKLAAVRAAAQHDFPTADVDEMLAEIERGYAAR